MPRNPVPVKLKLEIAALDALALHVRLSTTGVAEHLQVDRPHALRVMTALVRRGLVWHDDDDFWRKVED